MQRWSSCRSEPPNDASVCPAGSVPWVRIWVVSVGDLVYNHSYIRIYSILARLSGAGGEQGRREFARACQCGCWKLAAAMAPRAGWPATCAV